MTAKFHGHTQASIKLPDDIMTNLTKSYYDLGISSAEQLAEWILNEADLTGEPEQPMVGPVHLAAFYQSAIKALDPGVTQSIKVDHARYLGEPVLNSSDYNDKTIVITIVAPQLGSLDSSKSSFLKIRLETTWRIKVFDAG